MKFKSKEVSISDEELGCTISFSENEDNYEMEEDWSIDQIMAAIGQYISLQRTYPEDSDEKDYYSFESSEIKSTTELTDFKIDLYRTKFVLELNQEMYEIEIDIDDQTFANLKDAITKLVNGTGQLKFHF